MGATFDIQQALRFYKELGSVQKVGKVLGVCGQTIHTHLAPLGVIKEKIPFLTPKEEKYLKAHYREYANRRGGLQELATKFKKPKANLCRHARKLGLTEKGIKHSIKTGKVLTTRERHPITTCAVCGKEFKTKRGKERITCSKECYSKDRAEWIKLWVAKNGHHRGMLGKHHSEEFKKWQSERSKRYFKETPTEVLREGYMKAMKTKMARYGTIANPRPKTSWKQGWREIGNKRNYYRSRWEANYGRYLEFLKENKQIKEWEHEPETFWFEGLKRGTMSYLPDFRVTNLDGSIEYHEVKGWMDDRSKTKIKRMAKYYPHIVLKVYATKEYNALQKQVKGIIKDWE
jgi:hypothetical protein